MYYIRLFVSGALAYFTLNTTGWHQLLLLFLTYVSIKSWSKWEL
jgi:hypothetical protein